MVRELLLPRGALLDSWFIFHIVTTRKRPDKVIDIGRLCGFNEFSNPLPFRDYKAKVFFDGSFI